MNAKLAAIFEKIKTEFNSAFDIQPVITPAPAPAVLAAPAPASAPAIFSYAVDGGQPVFVDCSDDGIPDIDTNDPVYVDAAMSAPYPDGTYTVTGSQFGFTVAGGLVTVVTDAAGTGPGQPITDGATPAAPVTTDLAGAPPVPTLEERVKAIEAAIARATQPAKMSAEDELVITKLKEDNASLVKTVKELFVLVEQIGTEPTATPVTIPDAKKAKFEHAKKQEEKIMGYANAITQINKEKKN